MKINYTRIKWKEQENHWTLFNPKIEPSECWTSSKNKIITTKEKNHQFVSYQKRNSVQDDELLFL